MAAVTAFLAAFEIPPFAPKFDSTHPPIPLEYVGDWELVSNEPGQIRILPGGRAECHTKHGITSFDFSGARARLTPDRQALSIKFFFFGPTWHVDEPPHRNGDQFEMILDGKLYRRVREYHEAPGKDQVMV
jgi:hypothetical protein